MRILHVVHQYPPEYMGGTEYYTQSLAQKLNQRGHTTAIFTRRDGAIKEQNKVAPNEPLVYGAEDRVSPTQRFLSTFGKRAILDDFVKALDAFQPDIIHIQHMMGLPASLINEIHSRRIPFIVSLHDYWWVCANAQLLTNDSQQICDGPRLWLNCTRCLMARSQSRAGWAIAPMLPLALARRNQLLRQIVEQAHHLITPTNFVKAWHVDYGFPAEKITAIPLGVDPPSASQLALLELAQPQVIQPQLIQPRNTIRIVYIGGIAWQKGLHILIDAFNRLVGSCELWIAGDMSFDPDYTAQLQELASPNVYFLGRLSREEVWQTLANIDIVAVPALWYETYSILIREAFVMQKPVVASDLGALAESVRHGEDGVLVPPGDVEKWRVALQTLLDEPGKIAQLQHKICQPPTVEAHIDQVMKIYQEMVR